MYISQDFLHTPLKSPHDFMPRPLGTRYIMFSVVRPSFRLSVRSSVRSPKYHLFTHTVGPFHQPWLFSRVRPSACLHPSARKLNLACWYIQTALRTDYILVMSCWFSFFFATLTLQNALNLGVPGISRRTHGGNGLKNCMLMHTGHL